MASKVENLEKSMVKLTIEVDADTFEKAMNFAYNQNKGKISIQGFRKGKAPRKLIEKAYGAGVFYEDAANHIIPDAYDKAVEENKLEVVSRPEIDVEQIEAGKSFIFTAEVAVKPEIKLGQYKGLEVEKNDVEVTEEDVMAELNSALEKNARLIDVTDRAVEDEDQVSIDFEGFIDGEAFEGGKGEDFALTIGSKTFIDTFEEQLIGKNIGEEIEVNVTFPEDYQSEELQGKPALFKVKINSIKKKELPEIDDEFAMDVSEFDTLDEYKESIKESILERKEQEAKREVKEAVVKIALEEATAELPEPMIDLEAENMTYDFSRQLQQQGLDIEQYMKFTGQNMMSLKDSMKKEAEKKIKVSLLLEAIAKEEKLEVSDEEYDEEISNMATMYGMELDKLKENIKEEEKETIIQDMLNQKALDLMIEASVVKQ
jgi:trigger factor